MAARTALAVRDEYIAALRQACSCVSKVVLFGAWKSNRPEQPEDLELNKGLPVPLAGSARLSWSVRLRLRVVRAPADAATWQAALLAYQYTFYTRDGRELLAYHWHPTGAAEGGRSVSYPHLHLGAGAAEGRLRPEIAAAHLPTGAVTLPEIVHLAISDLGVRPLRQDWRAVLDRARAALSA